jgi:hypothetical protein
MVGRRLGLKNPATVEALNRRVLTLAFDEIRLGWEQWFLLTSDRHWDSLLSDREMQAADLEEAERRDALILDTGDALDVMQGKQDRRSDKSSLDGADKVTAYIDSVVDRAGDWFGRWSHRWPLLGMGNHESAVLDKLGTDLTDRTAARMRSANPNGITVAGGYDGWVRLMFLMRGTVRQSMSIYYHHGTGLSPTMTHGVLDTRRMASWIDADVILGGHTHTNYLLGTMRRRISDCGKEYSDVQHHVRIPSYKRMGGWETEKLHPAKPLGCVWLRLFYDGKWVRPAFVPDLRPDYPLEVGDVFQERGFESARSEVVEEASRDVDVDAGGVRVPGDVPGDAGRRGRGRSKRASGGGAGVLRAGRRSA